ncbi:MAG: hypothetical protein WC408_02230 [Candidatus Micrarchaeia archaeon]|jgi:hypothetical protein
MNKPRIVSENSIEISERTPPDAAGEKVLESYVPLNAGMPPQAVQEKGALQNLEQKTPTKPLQQNPSNQQPAKKETGLLGSIFSKLSLLFKK